MRVMLIKRDAFLIRILEDGSLGLVAPIADVQLLK